MVVTSSPSDDRLPETLRRYVSASMPGERPAETLASRVTSVDVKLAYAPEADQFVSFVLSDCNANPEGISSVHDAHTDGDLVRRAARSYLGSRDGDQFVAWLPTEVWSDDAGRWANRGSWLTSDRRALVEGLAELERVSSVYRASTRNSLSVEGERLVYDGPDVSEPTAVDGYVNLNDTGNDLLDALNRDISQFARGANAPTAVWTPGLEHTGKVGLTRSLTDLVDGLESVLVPRYQRVERVTELVEFRNRLDETVVLKDPFGTWGTGVVSIDLDDAPVEEIRQKERDVRSVRGWDDFRLLRGDDETFEFTSRGCAVQYGLAEEALEGNVSRHGQTYQIVSVPPDVHPLSKRSPIDLVVLAFAEPDGSFTAPSTMVRATGRPGLNGNPRFRYTNDASLERAMADDLSIPHPRNTDESFDFHLGERLDEIAGRHVTAEEIQEVVRNAAVIALAARNLSAFRAEKTLTSAPPKYR